MLTRLFIFFLLFLPETLLAEETTTNAPLYDDSVDFDLEIRTRQTGHSLDTQIYMFRVTDNALVCLNRSAGPHAGLDFEPGASDQGTPSMLAEGFDVGEQYLNSDPAHTLYVHGFADPQEESNPKAAIALSRARAETLKNQLENHLPQVLHARITVVAHGWERSGRFLSDAEAQAYNRRASLGLSEDPERGSVLVQGILSSEQYQAWLDMLVQPEEPYKTVGVLSLHAVYCCLRQRGQSLDEAHCYGLGSEHEPYQGVCSKAIQTIRAGCETPEKKDP